MGEFEKITEKMRERGIVTRVHYELMAIRAIKVAAILLIGVVLLLFK